MAKINVLSKEITISTRDHAIFDPDIRWFPADTHFV